jgi:hypothetical protein
VKRSILTAFVLVMLAVAAKAEAQTPTNWSYVVIVALPSGAPHPMGQRGFRTESDCKAALEAVIKSGLKTFEGTTPSCYAK